MNHFDKNSSYVISLYKSLSKCGTVVISFTKNFHLIAMQIYTGKMHCRTLKQYLCFKETGITSTKTAYTLLVLTNLFSNLVQ